MSGVMQADDKKILQQACEWYVQLQEEPNNEQTERAWQHWLAQDASHMEAWQKVSRFDQQLGDLHSSPSQTALQAPKTQGRRALLKTLSVVGITVLSGWVGARYQIPSRAEFYFAALNAQYRTQTGEIKEMLLADSSRLWVNTDSSVNIDYTSRQRAIDVQCGEIFIKTAIDTQTPARPQVVNCPHGRLLALGTEFTVRSDFNQTHLAVFSGQVQVTNATGITTLVKSGQQLSLNATQIQPTQTAEAFRKLWIKGLISVNNWRLDRFIHELSRYYQGKISLDDNLSDRRLVGTYSLNDISQTLKSLQLSLNIELTQLDTHHWRLSKK
jgi:transmembrane sensor